MPSKISIIVPIIVTFLAACGGGGGSSSSGENDNTSSSSSSSSSSSTGGGNNGSHNAGSDCMSACHEPGGAASSIFTIAGTVFAGGSSAQANGTVRVYAGGTNMLLTTLNTDDSGNFYTTAVIDELLPSADLGGFAQGVHVSLQGPNDNEDLMGPPSTLTGAVSCNSCHGVSRGTLQAN